MRIIAGSARSRKLKTVPDQLTRPTADRVKESIFNILSDKVIDARVLDLFAGSGNLGLEAISRGASFAMLVDNRLDCIKVMQENSTALGFNGKTEIFKGDVLGMGAFISKTYGSFDLIFIDPPYLKDLELPVLELIAQHNLLQPKGWIILEHHKKTVLEKEKIPFSCIREKAYGDTMVSFLRRGDRS